MKWSRRAVLLISLGVLVLVFSFPEPILMRAGRFMAPEENGKGEVAILEGGEMIETGAVAKGLDFLTSGRAGRLIIVVHEVPGGSKLFGVREKYPELIRDGLKDLGLRAEQFRVMKTPVRHPITLNEAKLVLGALSQEGVRSAVLLSSGFHTRRSLLAYQSIGKPLKIKIIPRAYFSKYELDRWWVQDAAVHDFISESLKLLYYQARGYIPLMASN